MCGKSHFNSEFSLLYLRVVQGCNLNCQHCFTYGNRDRYELAQIENISKFLTAIKRNVNPQQATVYIHGGEPFLAPLSYHREINQEVRKVFSNSKLSLIPQTNLMYKIDDEFIEFLHEEYGGYIGVSWDPGIRFGTTSRGLSEDLFFHNFRRLSESGIQMAVAITVQKHLLQTDPIDVVKQLEGAASIDFEFLTYFDEKTSALRVKNSDWSNYYRKIIQYYAENETTWTLPQADLFTKSIQENRIYQCKCNCCLNRTFTMNCNGTVGLCAYDAYYEPISDVNELASNWEEFADKARRKHIGQVAQQVNSLCQSCEYFDFCGGNCEPSLFQENDSECPMSKNSLKYQLENLILFKNKMAKVQKNLPELTR